MIKIMSDETKLEVTPEEEVINEGIVVPEAVEAEEVVIPEAIEEDTSAEKTGEPETEEIV